MSVAVALDDSDLANPKRRKLSEACCRITPSTPNHHAIFDDIDNPVQDASRPSIHMLSDECIDIILSYFATTEHFLLSSVCKRWYNLCTKRIGLLKIFNSSDITHNWNNSVWFKGSAQCRKLCISNVASILTLNIGSLAHLYLDFDVDFKRGFHHLEVKESDIFVVLSTYCPNLITLSIELYHSPTGLKLIFPELLPRRLTNFRLQCGSTHDIEALPLALSNAKNLKMLQLGALNGSTSFTEVFQAVEQQEIRYLSFMQCESLTPFDMETVLNTFYSTLEELSLSASYEPHHLMTNTELDISQDPKKKFLKLKNFTASQHSLFIGDYEFKNEKFNLQLLGLVPNLQVLDVSYNCYLNINPDFITVLVRACPLLKELYIGGCKLYGEKLEPLGDLKYLHHLDLSDDEQCGNFSWSFVVENVLLKIRGLKYLDVRYTLVTDEVAYNLIVNHPSLEVLDIGNSAIEGKMLGKLQNHERKIPLTVVDRADCAIWKEESALEGYLTQYKTVKLPEWLTINSDNVFSFEPESFWDKALKGSN